MFGAGASITVPPMVSVFTPGIGWVEESMLNTEPASAATEAVDRAIYYPLLLPVACVVRRVWWANGATTSGGATIEVGIYSDSGSYSPSAKLISGSAVQGTNTQVQFVDVTDSALAPGLYWIAIVSDSTTSTTLFRSQVLSTTTGFADAAFRFEQESARPLPATATPVESTNTNVYLCGFATTATP